LKVLIITYYWPPAGGSGVQRWLKFVKYLQDFNIEPVIYTVKNPNYAIADDSLVDEVPNNIEVLRHVICEPNNLFSFINKKDKTSAGFLDPNPSFFGKITQYIRANYFIPDARKFWIKPSVKFLIQYLKNNKIDAIISTGPPHSTHLIAQKLKERLNIKWIADFRDPWTEIDYFYQLPLTQRATNKHLALEKKVLKTADTILVVSKTMASNFKKFTKKVKVITNGYDSSTSIEKIKLDDKFSLVHIGLMNADRNPKTLWKVLSEICQENSDFKNDLQLKFIGKLANEVADSLEMNQLKNKAQFIDYVPHNEVMKYQKSAQILILPINNVPSAKGIITGKIFEYLQADRPILAIAPVDGDLAEIIKNTNSGIVADFDDEFKLKQEILKFYTEYKKGSLKSYSKNIEQYHRKGLTKQLSKIIKELFE